MSKSVHEQGRSKGFQEQKVVTTKPGRPKVSLLSSHSSLKESRAEGLKGREYEREEERAGSSGADGQGVKVCFGLRVWVYT